MKQNYNLSHRLIAYILFIGLFLQSCGGFQNQIVPQEKEQINDTPESSRQIEITKKLVEQKLTAEGWEVTDLYEEQGGLKVQAIEKHGNFTSKPHELSVTIAPDIDLGQVSRLNPKEQERRTHFNLPKDGQPGSINVVDSRIRGGMMGGESEKGAEDRKEDRGKEKQEGGELDSKQFEKKQEVRKRRNRGRRRGKAAMRLQEEKINAVKKGSEEIIKRDEEDRREGEIEEANRKKLKELEKAAEQGYAEAQNELGDMYYYAGNYKKAREWYQKASKQGDAAAQCNLGVMYANGRGVGEDKGKGVAWFQKAADQGYASAQYNLGVMYANGRGVEEDEGKAVAWFQKAAEQGQASAQYNLAVMYKNGSGVEKDERKAVAWFQKAAEQGHRDAQNVLGWMYYRGTVVGSRDYIRARLWLEKAAEQGHPEALCGLGAIYFFGQGIASNKEKGIVLYEMAAAQGDTEAQLLLKVLQEKGMYDKKLESSSYVGFKQVKDRDEEGKEKEKVQNDEKELEAKRKEKERKKRARRKANRRIRMAQEKEQIQ
ncbi:MAG: hypothetical protein BGO68_03665 [Candidatus Amoebophilus sp. 36-38]|nr:MAG: hypothetical protein BGO68_03665 [Candidatus Amoebophilus sp. 36-38]